MAELTAAKKLVGLFTATDLSLAVDRKPYLPTMLKPYFTVGHSSTVTVRVDSRTGKLTLVPDTPRGLPGTPTKRDPRKGIVIEAAHLIEPGRIVAEDLQDRLSFGSDSLETVADAVTDKLADMRANLEATLEYHRLGAIKGEVLDADGESVLYDMYELFEIEKPAAINWTPPSSGDGKNTVLETFQKAVRSIQLSMGGTPVTGVGAVVGDEFWHELITNPFVDKSYTLWASQHSETFGSNNFLGRPFVFGGIAWHLYTGSVSGNTMVKDGEAHLFPVARKAHQQIFAPADYISTVNTKGLDFYAHWEAPDHDRSVELEVQSNPVTLSMYPEALRTMRLA